MKGHKRKITRRKFLGTTLKIGAGMMAYPTLRHLIGRSNSPFRAFASAEKEPEIKELRLWASGTQTIEEQWIKLENELGIKILFADNGNAVGPVISKMVFGDAADIYDVNGLQGGAERELAEQGAILPWNMSLIPNWDEDVWPMVKNIPYHMVNGRRYGIPFTINADSISDGKYLFQNLYPAQYDLTIKFKSFEIKEKIKIPDIKSLEIKLNDFTTILKDTLNLSPGVQIDVTLVMEKLHSRQYRLYQLQPKQNNQSTHNDFKHFHILRLVENCGPRKQKHSSSQGNKL